MFNRSKSEIIAQREVELLPVPKPIRAIAPVHPQEAYLLQHQQQQMMMQLMLLQQQQMMQIKGKDEKEVQAKERTLLDAIRDFLDRMPKSETPKLPWVFVVIFITLIACIATQNSIGSSDRPSRSNIENLQ